MDWKEAASTTLLNQFDVQPELKKNLYISDGPYIHVNDHIAIERDPPNQSWGGVFHLPTQAQDRLDR